MQAIPKKFANNVREKLAGTVALRGPSGHIWDVRLTTNGDTIVLKEGWKAFIEDHCLEENDILIFKYNGNSRFDVSMFDQENFCEKEASYFVTKCVHKEIESGRKRPITMPERTDEKINELFSESSDDAVDSCSDKKPRNDTANTPGLRKERRKKNGRRGSSSRINTCPLQLTSRRRAVTEDEKKKALEMAGAASSGNSFMVVMRPSHVYNGFYMSIPYEWARMHLSRKSQDIVLRVKENAWQVKYHQKAYNNGGLYGGWKNFVHDNSLEESDVCLFDLASGPNDSIVLDVQIFRVAEEVVSPSQVTPGNSMPVTGGGQPSLSRNVMNGGDDA
ncbi:B3 domain-containing REM16-like [Olea europaea subsp. europaea]|uniref:B3 domain-containing REM16-like n=1 Tax=Olea europaea subsp. europaea TaxID=158383 RepID=A0A8S0TTV6_OLEEU|nr:B3 domain-containing REM16-like [Olea europaea subsp. europaea]